MQLEKGRLLAIVMIVAILALVIFAVWMMLTYNGFVRQEEAIDSQWAQVTNEYQRKIDLIPTLVATVSDYEEFESSTLENVTALRSQWMEAKSTEDQVNATNALDEALLEIILTYEAYPYLQAIEAVSNLMYSLEGTENRITVERMRYNEEVQDYNSDVRSFPKSIVAAWFDFEKRSYYQSEAGPEQP
jgi:LemA protein